MRGGLVAGLTVLGGARGAGAASIVAGVVLAAGDALNGHPLEGCMAFVALALVGAGVVVADRASRAAQAAVADAAPRKAPGGTGARRGDEGRASARTAVVLMCAIVIGLTAEIVQGRGGAPFTWLGLLGGATYLASSLSLSGAAKRPQG